MELSKVIPWGRSLNEYKDIFSLSNDDLNKQILGCGDGPACFNAELTDTGGNVISIDPVYQFNAEQIRSRIDEVYPQVINQLSQNKDDFIWESIKSVEALGKIRMQSMTRFLNDYQQGKEAGRYISASLPTLPFEDSTFDLALCSHYLFLYSEHVNREQHILSMRELCRVASEVRVYPLLSIDNNQISPHLEAVISDLTEQGINVSLVPVNYQFQKGATKMLVAKRVQTRP